ncbi:MAG: nitrate/nitrite transporter NrtS [Desulfuromonadales bacterium]|nr:nitrate/nitrite transporter NrtS [Desulfuromonadales bacterium]
MTESDSLSERLAGDIGLVEKMRTVTEPTIIARSLKVSLVAGTLYNLINQGEKVASLAFGEIDYLKLSLTYLMPYLVSTYTAVSMKMAECRDPVPK